MPDHGEGPSRTRGHQVYRIPEDQNDRLADEPRRALALFRALNHADDRCGTERLLAFAEQPLHREDSMVVIAEPECKGLAERLTAVGYPLTDAGIRRFTRERGFPAEVRIGPDVAAAYVRLARDQDVRLNVNRSTWETLSPELKAAIRIMLLIGHDPARFEEVRAALGIRGSASEQAGGRLVGRLSGERLLEWVKGHRWSLDHDGLERIARARGVAKPAVDEGLAFFVADAVACRGEPPHDYTRVLRNGHTINQRTALMMQQAEAGLPKDLWLELLVGSYAQRSRGAHPHTGGGVIDVLVGAVPQELIERMVQALREVGFAAWFRPRGSTPHIHAVAIGDDEAAPSAFWQMKAYFAGRDGRSRSGVDPHAVLPVQLPAWVAKYRIPHL